MSADLGQTDRPAYVIGVDYGTLSGRAVVVRVSDGAELGTGGHDLLASVALLGADRRALQLLMMRGGGSGLRRPVRYKTCRGRKSAAFLCVVGSVN